MPGGGKNKAKKRREPKEPFNSEDHDEGHANTDEEDGDSEAPELESLHEGIKSISRQITDLRTELKTDLATFKDDLRRELKADLNTFRDDMNQQLTASKLAIQEHGRKLEEAETRVAGIECWSAAAYGALKQSLKEQKKLAEKLDDLESRSRRNNLRIYGVPEGEEGSSVINFVEKLLRTEKLISEDMDTQIQRAHRSLGPKPGVDAAPRSIVVCFLQFKTKETVLRNAWQKKILIRDKPLGFDHDYTAAVVQQRRAYKDVKSALKQKGIRFQSPFTKLRIHWDSGLRCTRVRWKRRGGWPFRIRSSCSEKVVMLLGLVQRMRNG
ncbi:hypothetical protein WMY93_033694 [Mugilogobius chulae]|uniref:L1 transposable element RRM domain-containing protein n=1 Tax=Mugilogobius chulae TaxID=88201 RepID=A0AAW0MMS7_9GOBI